MTAAGISSNQPVPFTRDEILRGGIIFPYDESFRVKTRAEGQAKVKEITDTKDLKDIFIKISLANFHLWGIDRTDCEEYRKAKALYDEAWAENYFHPYLSYIKFTLLRVEKIYCLDIDQICSAVSNLTKSVFIRKDVLNSHALDNTVKEIHSKWEQLVKTSQLTGQQFSQFKARLDAIVNQKDPFENDTIPPLQYKNITTELAARSPTLKRFLETFKSASMAVSSNAIAAVASATGAKPVTMASSANSNSAAVASIPAPVQSVGRPPNYQALGVIPSVYPDVAGKSNAKSQAAVLRTQLKQQYNVHTHVKAILWEMSAGDGQALVEAKTLRDKLSSQSYFDSFMHQLNFYISRFEGIYVGDIVQVCRAAAMLRRSLAIKADLDVSTVFETYKKRVKDAWAALNKDGKLDSVTHAFFISQFDASLTSDPFEKEVIPLQDVVKITSELAAQSPSLSKLFVKPTFTVTSLTSTQPNDNSPRTPPGGYSTTSSSSGSSTPTKDSPPQARINPPSPPSPHALDGIHDAPPPPLPPRTYKTKLDPATNPHSRPIAYQLSAHSAAAQELYHPSNSAAAKLTHSNASAASAASWQPSKGALFSATYPTTAMPQPSAPHLNSALPLQPTGFSLSGDLAEPEFLINLTVAPKEMNVPRELPDKSLICNYGNDQIFYPEISYRGEKIPPNLIKEYAAEFFEVFYPKWGFKKNENGWYYPL